MLFEVEDQNREYKINTKYRAVARGFFFFILAIALIQLTWTIALPRDLFSTALWYDANNANKVFGEQVTSIRVWFLPGISTPQPVTMEAFAVGLILILMQILFAIMQQLRGGYKRWQNRGGFLKSIWPYLVANIYIVLYVFTACIDTFTDIMFSGTQHWVQVVINVMIYNFGPELFLTAGISLIAVALMDTFSQVPIWGEMVAQAKSGVRGFARNVGGNSSSGRNSKKKPRKSRPSARPAQEVAPSSRRSPGAQPSMLGSDKPAPPLAAMQDLSSLL